VICRLRGAEDPGNLLTRIPCMTMYSIALAGSSAAHTSGRFVLLFAGVSLGCSADGIMRPPVPSEEIHPTLIALSFRQTEPEPGWALRLDGRLATGTVMAEDQFVRVTVRTDDGAEVNAELSLRRMCKLPNGVEFACSEILVGVRADRSPDEILPLLDTLDGAYVNHTHFDSFTNTLVKLFSGDELEAMSRLAQHDAVLVTDVNGFVTAHTPPPALEELELPVFAFIRTTRRSEEPTPTLNRAGLEVERGTQVLARYRQPDGTTIEASITIP
jgi:hypothetical protein